MTELDLVDQYSTPSASGASLEPTDLERCWSWLGDPMLGGLVDRAERGSKGPVAETRAAIARGYIQLRARQARIGNARAYLAAQLDNFEIARFREKAKLVTVRDAVQADAERARVAATIPGLEAANAQDVAWVAVLGGQAPAALRDQLAPAVAIPDAPGEIAVGLPSDLLNRRADLRLAARRLRAASPLGMQPGGARATYKRAVLAALEEVEKGQASFVGAVAHAQALATAAEKADTLAGLTRDQYRSGLADYGALSSAEAALLAARDALTDARAARARASIGLCLALGGGGGIASKPGK